MSDLHFYGAAILILMGTAIVILFAMLGFKKVQEIKSWRIQEGIYQHKRTGSIVEARNFDGHKAYVGNENGTWFISCQILERDYEYVGNL